VTSHKEDVLKIEGFYQVAQEAKLVDQTGFVNKVQAANGDETGMTVEIIRQYLDPV
jgi:hypothetical protein